MANELFPKDYKGLLPPPTGGVNPSVVGNPESNTTSTPVTKPTPVSLVGIKFISSNTPGPQPIQTLTDSFSRSFAETTNALIEAPQAILGDTKKLEMALIEDKRKRDLQRMNELTGKSAGWDNESFWDTAARTLGEFAGTLMPQVTEGIAATMAGGTAGQAIGTAAGTLTAPVTGPVGPLVGGVGGRVVGSAAGMIGSAIHTAGSVQFSTEARNAYDALINKGLSHQEAFKQALDVANANAKAAGGIAAVAAPLGPLAGRVAGPAVGRAIFNTAGKTGTSAVAGLTGAVATNAVVAGGIPTAATTAASNVIAQDSYDPQRTLMAGVPESLAVGTIANPQVYTGAYFILRNAKPIMRNGRGPETYQQPSPDASGVPLDGQPAQRPQPQPGQVDFTLVNEPTRQVAVDNPELRLQGLTNKFSQMKPKEFAAYVNQRANDIDIQNRTNDPEYTGSSDLAHLSNLVNFLAQGEDIIAKVQSIESVAERNNPQNVAAVQDARERLNLLRVLQNPVIQRNKNIYVMQTAPDKKNPYGQSFLARLGADGMPIVKRNGEWIQLADGRDRKLKDATLFEVTVPEVQHVLYDPEVRKAIDKYRVMLDQAPVMQAQQTLQTPQQAQLTGPEQPKLIEGQPTQQLEGPGSPQQYVRGEGWVSDLSNNDVIFVDEDGQQVPFYQLFRPNLAPSTQRQVLDEKNQLDFFLDVPLMGTTAQKVEAWRAANAKDVTPAKVSENTTKGPKTIRELIPADKQADFFNDPAVWEDPVFKRSFDDAAFLRSANQREAITPAVQGADAVIQKFYINEKPAIQSGIKAVFREFEEAHGGRGVTEIDVLDLATALNPKVSDITNAAVYLPNWITKTGNRIRMGAIALRKSGGDMGTDAIESVAHELTHAYLRTRGVDATRLADFYRAMKVLGQTEKDVAKDVAAIDALYGDMVEAMRGEELLTKWLTDELVGKFKPEEPRNWTGTRAEAMVRDFIKRIVDFTRKVFGLDRNVIDDFFSRVADTFDIGLGKRDRSPLTDSPLPAYEVAFRQENPWYSQMAQAIEQAIGEGKVPKQSTAKEWKNILNNMQARGFSKEEMRWVGVDDWLTQQSPDAKIAATDVLDFVKNNMVQIEINRPYVDGLDWDNLNPRFEHVEDILDEDYISERIDEEFDSKIEEVIPDALAEIKEKTPEGALGPVARALDDLIFDHEAAYKAIKAIGVDPTQGGVIPDYLDSPKPMEAVWSRALTHANLQRALKAWELVLTPEQLAMKNSEGVTIRELLDTTKSSLTALKDVLTDEYRGLIEDDVRSSTTPQQVFDLVVDDETDLPVQMQIVGNDDFGQWTIQYRPSANDRWRMLSDHRSMREAKSAALAYLEERVLETGSHEGTRWHDYRPGPEGSNYTEFLITLADIPSESDSPALQDPFTYDRHWNEQNKNFLAHVRFDEHYDPTDGEKILLIQELQSDWATAIRDNPGQLQRGGAYAARAQAIFEQIGRLEFSLNGLIDEFRTYLKPNEQQSARFWTNRLNGPDNIDTPLVDVPGILNDPAQLSEAYKILDQIKVIQKDLDALRADRDRLSYAGRGTIPEAPFVGDPAMNVQETWQNLAMKHMLMYAAKNGFKRLAWTTGAMNAKEWSKSNFVGVKVIERTPYFESEEVRDKFKTNYNYLLNKGQIPFSEAEIGMKPTTIAYNFLNSVFDIIKTDAPEHYEVLQKAIDAFDLPKRLADPLMKFRDANYIAHDVGKILQLTPLLSETTKQKFVPLADRLEEEARNLWHAREDSTFGRWVTHITSRETKPFYVELLDENGNTTKRWYNNLDEVTKELGPKIGKAIQSSESFKSSGVFQVELDKSGPYRITPGATGYSVLYDTKLVNAVNDIYRRQGLFEQKPGDIKAAPFKLKGQTVWSVPIPEKVAGRINDVGMPLFRRQAPDMKSAYKFVKDALNGADNGVPKQAVAAKAMAAFARSHLGKLFTHAADRIRADGYDTPAAIELGNHFDRGIFRIRALSSGTPRADFDRIYQPPYNASVHVAAGPFQRRMLEVWTKIPEAAHPYVDSIMRGMYQERQPDGTMKQVIPAFVYKAGFTPEIAQELRQVMSDIYFKAVEMMKENPYTKKQNIPDFQKDYMPQRYHLEGKFGQADRPGQDPALEGLKRDQVAFEFFKKEGFFAGNEQQDASIDNMLSKMMGDGGLFITGDETNPRLQQVFPGLPASYRGRLINIDPNKTHTVTVGDRTAKVRFADLIDNRVDRVIGLYPMSMMRSAEYTRRFGPNGEEIERLLMAIQKQARERGKRADLKSIAKAIRAGLGVLGREWVIDHPFLNSLNGWASFASTAPVMTLSQIASLPELVQPAIRLGIMHNAESFKSFMDQLASTQKGKDLAKLTADLGIIHHELLGGVLGSIENFNDITPQKANSIYYKTITLTAFTRATEKGAVAASMLALDDWKVKGLAGDAKAVKALREVGLTLDQVRNVDRNDFDTFTKDRRVKAAIYEMVRQMVLAPDGARKPVWMSSPQLKIFTLLKSYMTNFANFTIPFMLQRAKEDYNFVPLLMGVVAAYIAAQTFLVRDYAVWGEDGNPHLKKLGLGPDNPTARLIYLMLQRGGYTTLGFYDVTAIPTGTRGGDYGVLSTLSPAIGAFERTASIVLGTGFYLFTGDEAAKRAAVDAFSRSIPVLNTSGNFRTDLVNEIAPTASMVKAEEREAMRGLPSIKLPEIKLPTLPTE